MILDIAYYPNTVLRTETQVVGEISTSILKLVQDLGDTMRALKALGIAAPQVGRLERIFIIDGHLIPGASSDPDPLVFINPELVGTSGGEVTRQEGCLSFPTVFLDIRRAREVHMKAINLDGMPFEIKAKGLLARALQHEFEHLDGRLMIDHVGFSIRDSVHRRVQRWREERGKTGF